MIISFSSDYMNEDDFDFKTFGLHIIANKRKAHRLPRHTLNIEIKAGPSINDSNRINTTDIMFLGDDLPTFCRALLLKAKDQEAKHLRNFLRTSSLLVELNCVIAGKSAKNSQSASWTPKIIEQFLQPLCQLHSLQAAYVVGDLDDHFKADLCASICSDPSSTDAVLNDVLTALKKGDKAFANNKFEEAISIYQAAARDNGDRAYLWPVPVYDNTPGAMENIYLHHATLGNRLVCRKKLAKTYLKLRLYKDAYKWSHGAVRQIERHWKGPTLRPIPGPYQKGDWIEAHWLKAQASEGRGWPKKALEIVKELVRLSSDPVLDAEMKRLEGNLSKAKA